MNAQKAACSAALALFVLCTLSAHADDGCDAPVADWQPRSAVDALAKRNSWRIDHLKIDDGCYEIKGLDAEGYRFRAKLDPVTLTVVGMKREHEKHRDHLHDAPASETPGKDR